MSAFFMLCFLAKKQQCLNIFVNFNEFIPKNIAMKLAYHIKQKSKIAFLLFGIMVCTILIRIAEDRSIANIGTKIKSMYNDRLVPATDLFYISENIHAKRILTDGYLKDQSGAFALNNAPYNSKINQLIKKYELTYLTEEERIELNAFKSAYAKHLFLEKKLIEQARLAKANYAEAMDQSYQNLFLKLNALTKIQSKVGEELIKNVQSTLNGTQIYTHLQYILSLFIGLMVMGLLMASKVINIKSENFHLN